MAALQCSVHAKGAERVGVTVLFLGKSKNSHTLNLTSEIARRCQMQPGSGLKINTNLFERTTNRLSQVRFMLSRRKRAYSESVQRRLLSRRRPQATLRLPSGPQNAQNPTTLVTHHRSLYFGLVHKNIKLYQMCTSQKRPDRPARWDRLA